MDDIILSNLSHTWLIDVDGTIVEHNGYLSRSEKLLPGVKEFFEKIPKKDIIFILTARNERYRSVTKDFLKKNEIRFDQIIFGLPSGEIFQINDIIPKGLNTAVALNIERNNGLKNIEIKTDNRL